VPRAFEALSRLVPLVLVVAGTFVAFLPVLHAGFLNWDDRTNLVRNANVRGLGWSQLRWMFTSTRLGHYTPITWLSFGLNYVLGGMNPLGYHLGNLLLHAANAGLFYLVTCRLLAEAFRASVGARPSAGTSASPDLCIRVGAAFAALCFGVHPLRVESVAWVTERRDVLCGLFTLLTVLAYLTFCRRREPACFKSGWYWASLAFFALALLSKSIVVAFPLVLMALDVHPLRRLSFADRSWRGRAGHLVVEKLPFLALSAVISAVMLVAGWRGVLTPIAMLGVPERLAISGYGLAFYLEKAVVPWPLSPLYELHYPVRPLSATYLLPAALVVVIATAVVRGRHRIPGAAVAGIAYVALLLPVIGWTHNGEQVTADRYTYLSELGFAVLAAGGLTWVLRRRERFEPWIVTACVAAAALVVVGWGAASWRQSAVWHDTETLWRSALRVDPDCTICGINLGAELIARRPPDPHGVREAEALFRHALSVRPDRTFGYHGLGVSLVLQQRYDEAEVPFRRYAEQDPTSAVGPLDLGLLRLFQHRHLEAIELLRRARAIDPRVPGLADGLSRALRERSRELRDDGRSAEADALLAEADRVQGAPREVVPRRSQGSDEAIVR
jgi:hypothetical protein